MKRDERKAINRAIINTFLLKGINALDLLEKTGRNPSQGKKRGSTGPARTSQQAAQGRTKLREFLNTMRERHLNQMGKAPSQAHDGDNANAKQSTNGVKPNFNKK